MKRATYISLLLALIVTLVFGQQGASPITREGLLGALKTGALSGKELIGEVHTYGVSFELTTADEEQIRHAGKYLGKKELDDLISAVRDNYRAPLQPVSPTSDDAPLSFLNGIAVKGSPKPQKLDALMKASGYSGSTMMSVLMVTNDAMVGGNVLVGTQPQPNIQNSQLLEPGTQFNFPGGENTARVYVLSAENVKIDVTYKPRVISAIAQPSPRPTPTPDWKESDEAKKLASEILTEIQNLIDEGNLIDLTDYQAAAKAYVVWVEKSSVSLGRLDIKMRRFTEKDTEYKDGFDKATATGRETRPSSKDYESSDKEILRSNIKIALSHLNLAKKLAEIYTRPDVDAIRMGVPKD